ncbi:hypothetical protein C5167_002599 [Papaver somniferum]|uniref:Uncharacterized protein n=1 Tax=Papaver somniferum TaxID=3469 RepID=A0A4Y7L2E1_PAPSO|nr:hypothetical protein C5167_002599 [Papaver somniferum]
MGKLRWINKGVLSDENEKKIQCYRATTLLCHTSTIDLHGKILSPEVSRLQSEFAKTVTAVAQWRWWWRGNGSGAGGCGGDGGGA